MYLWGVDLQADWLWGLVMGIIVAIYCMGADSMGWFSGCVINQVVLWFGLKLATRCVGSKAFWEELWCWSRSATVHVLPRVTLQEQQSDLWLVASFAGLGGSWEWLCCKLSQVWSH